MTAPAWYEAGRPHVWLPYAQMKTAPAPLAFSALAAARGLWTLRTRRERHA